MNLNRSLSLYTCILHAVTDVLVVLFNWSFLQSPLVTFFPQGHLFPDFLDV